MSSQPGPPPEVANLYRRVVGELQQPGEVPAAHRQPYETITPAREGFIERNGVKTWYAIWGAHGPWIAFAPVFQITHSQILKTTVPYLSRHFRVITTDLRGNGRSDRPTGAAHYCFDEYYADFVAVLDATAGADPVACTALSVTAMTAIRLAAEQPQRLSHLIIVGGFPSFRMDDPAFAEVQKTEARLLHEDWPSYLARFFSMCFPEPHSTKPFEDSIRYAWCTTPEVLGQAIKGWLGTDVSELARKVRCPTLVIHGDADGRVPIQAGQAIHQLIPGSRMLTIAGGGHLPAVRDPVIFNRSLRDFIAGSPRTVTWTRGMNRRRRALFISSPIGLGHVQRDLAIARELRKLHPDLAIDWFTVDPAIRYLEREGELVHPITQRLANESRHFEHVAGEHDLSCFFALRTMDEIAVNNFMTFSDLMEQEHYDLVIGDESWEVDYYYHENPEAKRQPFVFLTDFVGCLPMEDNEREAYLCADRNAEDIEHVARFPYVRDAAIFVGNPEDVTDQHFGPGLPRIRQWVDRNFSYSGYTLPFDPQAFADIDRVRARLGYRNDEKILIAAVGGTGVGRALLDKIARAFPHMRRQEPNLRMVLVVGPRLDPNSFPQMEGLEIRPYVHNLFEHLACCDVALVQGGLSTCMELVAMRRPFVSFPLKHHFEQNIHVRRRLANYGADRSVAYDDVTAESLADTALSAMHSPVSYKRVETNGAALAALRIAEVLDNRRWVR